MRIVSIGSMEAAWVYGENRSSKVLAVLTREMRMPGDFGSAFKIHRASIRELTRNTRDHLFDDTDILHIALDRMTKRLLMDAIAACRRVQPKLLVVSMPSAASSEIEATALEFARRKGLYLARFATLTASSFGACVAKSSRFLIAIRIDVAKRSNLRNDADVAQLLPRPAHTHPLSLDVALKKAAPNREEEEFWARRFRKSPKQYQLAGRLKLDPARATRLRSLVRVSRQAALPIPREGELLIHPTANRGLTSTELASAWGYPTEVQLRGSYDDRSSHVQSSIPFPLLQALGQSLIIFLADAAKRNPLALKRIQDRYILEDTPERRVYATPEDLGDGAGHKLHGKSPLPTDYDHVFDADEIGKDFVVYGPADANGRPVLIGAVKRGAYKPAACKEFAKLIGTIRVGTDARTDASPLQVTDFFIRNQAEKGYEVQVTKDRRQQRQREKGTEKWGRWRTPKIRSTTYGWTRDKNTAEPKLTKNFDKNAEPIRRLLRGAESAYLKLERDEFIKHAEMMRRRIDRRYRLIRGGLFTTLAINCYGREMPAMNYHIDKNGDESGLATISVFRRGKYDGGLLCCRSIAPHSRSGTGMCS